MKRVQEPHVGVGPSSELERIYRDQADRLWWAMLGFGGDPELASDVVAETFAQALRRGGELRRPERWIWKAAFRIAAGELKDRRRRAEPVAEAGWYEMPEPARELVEALRELTPKQRQAVVLHYVSGYGTKEIGSMIGSTAAAVRVHLSQGRKRLRRSLEEDDA